MVAEEAGNLDTTQFPCTGGTVSLDYMIISKPIHSGFDETRLNQVFWVKYYFDS